MHILITGGCGFIGGRLAVHLAQVGHRIILGSRKILAPPYWLPQAEVVPIHWDDTTHLERTFHGVDVVIHAAGMNAQDSGNDPVAALAFNGVATARLVTACSRAGVKRFIYFSTAHVYGNPMIGIITENTCPRNLHPYATSHLAGEQAVLRANQQGQIQGIVFRLSNVCGVPMHKDVNCWMLLVNDLCMQAVQKRKLVLQTSGLQQRDFISMNKVCRVTEFLVVGCGADTVSGIFNVGTGVSQTVLEMAKLIEQRCTCVLGFKPVLHHREFDSNEQGKGFTFKTNNLAKIGINIKEHDNILEIDNLLQFCNSKFTPK